MVTSTRGMFHCSRTLLGGLYATCRNGTLLNSLEHQLFFQHLCRPVCGHKFQEHLSSTLMLLSRLALQSLLYLSCDHSPVDVVLALLFFRPMWKMDASDSHRSEALSLTGDGAHGELGWSRPDHSQSGPTLASDLFWGSCPCV